MKRLQYGTPVFRSIGLLAGLAVLGLAACEPDYAVLLPFGERSPPEGEGWQLVARIAHITDTHIVDEESPARFAGAHALFTSAWRPYEACSAQLLDGLIRTINRMHASGRTIDFVLHTGDACDNAQGNELQWFLRVMDGLTVDPLSGPDDRPPDLRPPVNLDPHAAFTPQGLYRQGRHGHHPSIPWYITPGNHDRFGIGVFAIFEDFLGRRTAPLPFPQRPGVLLPSVLDPTGWLAHGNVTPAEPGPPCFLELPRLVVPNPARRYFDKREFVQALFSTETLPSGHGYEAPAGPTWYSVSPVPGLRLVGLDTCEPAWRLEGFPYQDGSLSAAQVAFLRAELAAAGERGEWVVVASHHPSASLWAGYGSAVAGEAFRELLNSHSNVILHLAGHSHRNRVADRGGYLEIETCSTLDAPQQGRLVEIWRHGSSGAVHIQYEMFSHLDTDLPPLGDDPLRGLREEAWRIAHRQENADPP